MEIRANKYLRVLKTLQNNPIFFLSFDLDIAFYWCDLEERQEPNVARKLYQQLSERWPCYQVYRRWLQLERRQKQPTAVKAIYELLIAALGEDYEGVSAVVVEYCDFGMREWKDLDWGR